jgi:hypothetical protein
MRSHRVPARGHHWLALLLVALVGCRTVPASNLSHGALPSALVAAAEAPYANPHPAGCDALATEIRELDLVLGPDLDRTPSPHAPGSFVGALVAGEIKAAIPYYGWIRRLTGVEARARRTRAAIAAGAVRRAYLKGLGEARQCPPPASPARLEVVGGPP